MNSNLVSITSHAENSFITKTILFDDFTSFWIGLNDRDEENKFRWIDGTVYTGEFSMFASGEPNNGRGRENCVVIKGDGEWNDRNCEQNSLHICKKRGETRLIKYAAIPVIISLNTSPKIRITITYIP